MRSWNPEVEGAAFTRSAGDAYLAAVALNYLFADRQAKTSAGFALAVGSLHLAEALKNGFDMGFRDTATGVADSEFTKPAPGLALRLTLEPGSENLMALESRLTPTWTRRSASALISKLSWALTTMLMPFSQAMLPRASAVRRNMPPASMVSIANCI